MKDIRYRGLAWGTAVLELILLAAVAVMLLAAPDHTSPDWLYAQVSALVAMGAPILGLIIITRQPRQRIGWLWMFYGLFVGLRTLGLAIYYSGGAQFAGYSALEYFLLWFSELAGIAVLVCIDLLLLWFPDGQLASRRWRLIYVWLFLAIVLLAISNFRAGPNWNGGADAGGIVIDNPYGWLPEDFPFFITYAGFFSLVLISVLAAVSLIFRYRAAGQVIRLQIRWFVLGGFLTIGLEFVPVFFPTITNSSLLLLVLGYSSIVPLYAAVGVAILRYRLFDIDVIIRKTVVYAVLSALLALVYFGLVILLQSAFETLSGEQSPIAVVLSTLIIATLFTPLRRRVQKIIDRRFYRRKYDAQLVLEQFGKRVRDATDMAALTVELTGAIRETMQPEQMILWLKPVKNDDGRVA